ncbi:cupin domain-containing protein [Aurantimonas sp. C2-5-R2]|uniref:cupin domain-containing protein n=2 Tax=Aurantimonas TaxID=182269 RepID=UPI002E19CC77|nr:MULTISPECIES: cupin domain-containing protein [unclassified Aurantimonas]MEC5291885.1 cupin domain-containing protein [Aurantimonas sp. C2-3-R2]MEC5324980.1 cupin domain-containing protein [Aurantimonas sp. A3-2-R12]MEC5412971.1 cupin domain-containing protein [Aurantimonas sp. C2-4-R8]
MKVSLDHFLGKLPLPATAEWPDGVFHAEALSHGTMTLEIFAPRGEDRQRPHSQDELYIIASGQSDVVRDGERGHVRAGDALFVRAGTEHRFEGMSDNFVTWVVFWGPPGGEAPAPSPSVFAAIDA